MASVLKFATNPVELEDEIKRRGDLAELSARANFIAARKIQAWFRGILTRNHFRVLRKMATIIQSHWRGYYERMRIDRYLIDRVHQMWDDYYNRMATRIQAAWRGYWIRKTCVNFLQMKNWLRYVYAKNEETLENMKKFKENEIEHLRGAVEEESMLAVLFILYKIHYLLRTKKRPGVISRIDETRSTSIEKMLKCLEYDLFSSERAFICKDCQIDPKPSLVFRGTYFERCEREIREFEKSLCAGHLPIFRSETYDDGNKFSRKIDRLYHEILRRNKYGTRCFCDAMTKQKAAREKYRSRRESDHETRKPMRKGSCTLLMELNSKFTHVGQAELCEKIREMECRLDQLGMKCPIHHFVSSA